MDLVLPGSVIGGDTISVFSTYRLRPIIETEKLAIKIGEYVKNGGLYILPVTSDPKSICDSQKNYVTELRLESEGYATARTMHKDGNERFKIEKITGGRAHFFVSHILGPDAQKALRIEEYGASRLRSDWHEGIKKIFQYASSLPEVELLPPEEGQKLLDLSNYFRDLYEVTTE
jgi:hypothetical protein